METWREQVGNRLMTIIRQELERQADFLLIRFYEKSPDVIDVDGDINLEELAAAIIDDNEFKELFRD